MLTNVRRVIRFRQEAWIAPYIAENTRLRQAAVDKFEKDYYKLLNNALFGKTMENVRKRVKIVLVNKGRSHAWQTSKPTFKRFEIFDENLVGVEVAQTTITLDKPIYVGFSVLELSKLLIEFIGEFFINYTHGFIYFFNLILKTYFKISVSL